MHDPRDDRSGGEPSAPRPRKPSTDRFTWALILGPSAGSVAAVVFDRWWLLTVGLLVGVAVASWLDQNERDR